jgi:hypothetical protein
MNYKQYDPITYRYPRTTEDAFNEHPDPIECPHEPSLFRWWGELLAACAVVMFCVFVVRILV